MAKNSTVCILLFYALPLVAGVWNVQTVDAEGILAGWSSLALDSSDEPHIVYYRGDAPNIELKYAFWDGFEWSLETLITNVGACVSLALDSLDRPHLSYHTDLLGNQSYELWYAYRDGVDWSFNFVDADGSCNYIAIDDMDHPHIAFYGLNGEITNLKYASLVDSTWQVETVDYSEDVGQDCTLKLDTFNNPHIAYLDSPNNDVKYAYWDGLEWRIEVIDPSNRVGWDISLDLDSYNNPFISYYDYDTGRLKCAFWDGYKWQFDDVTDAGFHGAFSSIAVDSDDEPHIAFLKYNGDHYSLMYANRLDTSWFVDKIDEYADGASFPSIKIDDLNQPCISYYSDAKLKYAWHEGEFSACVVELDASPADGGILVGWIIHGEIPAGLRILRESGGEISQLHDNALPGTARRFLDRDVEAGIEYRYWMDVTEADGSVSRFGPTKAVTLPEPISELVLSAYPSPASDAATVAFTLSEAGPVELAVFDLAGRRMATLVDEELSAGRHEVTWDCASSPSGVYLYRLVTESGSLTRRLVVSR